MAECHSRKFLSSWTRRSQSPLSKMFAEFTLKQLNLLFSITTNRCQCRQASHFNTPAAGLPSRALSFSWQHSQTINKTYTKDKFYFYSPRSEPKCDETRKEQTNTIQHPLTEPKEKKRNKQKKKSLTISQILKVSSELKCELLREANQESGIKWINYKKKKEEILTLAANLFETLVFSAIRGGRIGIRHWHGGDLGLCAPKPPTGDRSRMEREIADESENLIKLRRRETREKWKGYLQFEPINKNQKKRKKEEWIYGGIVI